MSKPRIRWHPRSGCYLSVRGSHDYMDSIICAIAFTSAVRAERQRAARGNSWFHDDNSSPNYFARMA